MVTQRSGALGGDEFGLHPVAVEDVLYDWERPKIDRCRTHLFLTAYGVSYLLHGLLDCIVDGHFEAVQSLDDAASTG